MRSFLRCSSFFSVATHFVIVLCILPCPQHIDMSFKINYCRQGKDTKSQMVAGSLVPEADGNSFMFDSCYGSQHEVRMVSTTHVCVYPEWILIHPLGFVCCYILRCKTVSCAIPNAYVYMNNERNYP